MARTPSSVAWVAARYTRAKGTADRRAAQIAWMEDRKAFHENQARQYTQKIAGLKEDLEAAELAAAAHADTLGLHERAAPPHMAAIRPHEIPAPLGRGGLTRWLVRTFKASQNQTLSIDELTDALAARLQTTSEARARTKYRLQVRLNILSKAGRVEALDPPRHPQRRWRLADSWAAPVASPQKTGRRRFTSGGIHQPALWLIRTQQDILRALRKRDSMDKSTVQRLEESLTSLQKTWSAHPLHFELDVDGRIPKDSRHGDVARMFIKNQLTQAPGWRTVAEIHGLDATLLIGVKRISLNAIEKALKSMLLEGLVENRRTSDRADTQWRWKRTNRG